MKIAIVFESVTGNTAQLAEALRFHFRGQDTVLIQSADADVLDQDVVFAGSWTDKGDCSPAMAALLEKLEKKKLFLFGTCGYGGSQEYFDTIYRRFASHVKPDNKILGSFFCQGRMPVTVLRRYEAMLEANPNNARWESCIENYNEALAHPNACDLASLCAAADQALGMEATA